MRGCELEEASQPEFCNRSWVPGALRTLFDRNSHEQENYELLDAENN